jgi:hypothetical protein
MAKKKKALHLQQVLRVMALDKKLENSCRASQSRHTTSFLAQMIRGATMKTVLPKPKANDTTTAEEAVFVTDEHRVPWTRRRKHDAKRCDSCHRDVSKRRYI